MDGRCGQGKISKTISFDQLYGCHFELKVWNLTEYFVNYKHQSVIPPFLKNMVPTTSYIYPSEDQARPIRNISFGDKREIVDIIILSINYNSNMSTLDKTRSPLPYKKHPAVSPVS